MQSTCPYSDISKYVFAICRYQKKYTAMTVESTLGLDNLRIIEVEKMIAASDKQSNCARKN